MKTRLLTILLIFNCTSIYTFGQKNILFVGVDGEVSGSADNYLITGIETAVPEYSVTFLAGPDFAANDAYKDAAGYAGYDAIFFSESASSGDLTNFKDAGFPIPTVCTEGYAPRTDKWALLTDDATQHDQINSDELEGDNATINIIDNTHYITEVFDQDYALDWTTDTERGSGLAGCGFKLNENILDAVPLGIYSLSFMADYPTIWAIPEASTLESNTDITLPRMVFIGVYITTLGEFATPDINNVFIRSLKWVMDDIPSSVSREIASSDVNLAIGPNPADTEVNLSFYIDRTSLVSVTLFDLSGKIVHNTPATQFAQGDNSLNLDLSALENGLYICKLDINGYSSVGKLVISR